MTGIRAPAPDPLADFDGTVLLKNAVLLHARAAQRRRA